MVVFKGKAIFRWFTDSIYAICRKKNDWSSKRVPFDARDILEKYGNWNWGEYTIAEAHLSERFVYDDNGYYHCVSAIPFPSHAT